MTTFNQFDANRPEPVFEFLGLSLPAYTTIFAVACVLIPLTLGLGAMRNPLGSALLFVAFLALLAFEHGRWSWAFISGDVDRPSYAPHLKPLEILAFVASFTIGLGVTFVARRFNRENSRTAVSS